MGPQSLVRDDQRIQKEAWKHLWSLCLGTLCVLAVVSLGASRTHWQDLNLANWARGMMGNTPRQALPLYPRSPSTVLPPPLSPPPQPPAAKANQQAVPAVQAAPAAPAAESADLRQAPDPSAWRLPWQPLLRQMDVQRGLSYYGSGRRLRAVAAKLLAGKPIKLYTVGGSVTYGTGATEPRFGYAYRFFEFINSTFPHSQHVFHNKGIGATSSGLFAVCTEHMIERDTDLIVLEFTINEPADAPYTTNDRRGYELLLRKLLKLPSRPAIIQLHHHKWWTAEGDAAKGVFNNVQAGVFYVPAGEAQLTVFSQYYDFPSVSVRAAVHPLMRAGLKGFQSDKVLADGQLSTMNHRIPSADPRLAANYFYADRTHPTDHGHQVLAELLASVVLRAAAAQTDTSAAAGVEGLAAWPGGTRLGIKCGAQLPPPMIPGNIDAATTLCAIQEDFRDAVSAFSGFTYLPEKPNGATFVAQKWAWRGTKPGDWVEIEFDSRRGDAVDEEDAEEGGGSSSSSGKGGAEGNAGPPSKAMVYLTYLRSYQGGMGTADITCVWGCSCPTTSIDGSWKQPTSMQQMHRFLVTEHAECCIRVQVSSREGSVPQGAHKVSLMGLIVSHIPLRTKTKLDTLQSQ